MQAPPDFTQPPNTPVKKKGMSAVFWIIGGVLFLCCCAGIVPALLFPVFAQARAAAINTRTLKNTKEAGLAVILYAADYNDVLPAAASWMDAAQPYLGPSSEPFHNASVGGEVYGLAFNSALSKVEMASIKQPEQMVLVFTSSVHERNAHGGKDILFQPVDSQAGAVAYADSSAKAYRRTGPPAGLWTP